MTASFVYDGDGNRVKSTISGTTTTFVGNHYEVSGSTVTRYYYAGAQRVAMSMGSTVYYLLSDQLGSTSITTNSSGTKVAELRYKAWGEVRFTNGGTPTKYTYTGQYSNADDFGLMYYNARWYDPTIARFAQADTIVPDGVQGYDRYAYGLNNPSRYTDPTGHWVLESNDPEDEVRFKAFYHAYERVNDKDSPLAAHKKEYYLTAAAYYWARMEGSEIDIQIGADLLQSRADAVRINGWNSQEDAQSTAADAAGFEALGLANFGLNLAGMVVTWKGVSIEVSQHAEEQMQDRGLTVDQVQDVMDKNGSFFYQHEGVTKQGWYDKGKGILVTMALDDQTITTVMTHVDPQYIAGLRANPWK